MSKYLFFIILGIILFLYINSIEGLNVGGKDIGEDCEEDGNCNDGNGICQNDHCYCVDVGGNSICQLKTPDPNADGEKGRKVQDRISEIDNIKLQTLSEKAVRHLSSQCAALHYPLSKKLKIIMTDNDNTKKSYCEDTYQYVPLNSSCDIMPEEYKELSCDFDFTYEDDTPPNNYENFGYEKLQGFIDLENDSIFQEFIGQIQTDFSRNGLLNHPTLNLGNADTPLNFSVYMLIKYIERISNSNIKTIVPGIFYCNGKIYYYISYGTLFRTVNSKPSIDYIDDPYLVEQMNKYYFLSKFNTSNDASFPQIHVDAPNIGGIPPKLFIDYALETGISEEHDTNYKPVELSRTKFNLDDNSCELSTSFSVFERSVLATRDNYLYPISFKQAFDNEMTLRTQSRLNVQTGNFENATLMLYHLINHNKNDQNYDLFNIWLQLVGTYDDKTLGFFNSPPTNKGLEDLTRIDNDDTKLSVIYSDYVQNPVSVDHLPDKTAHTFVMNDGDALRFTDDKTPHFGRSSEHGIRFSKEGRYLLYYIDFDLNSVFEISQDGTTLLVKTNADNVPNVLPPYLPLTIYKWFQDEFSLISQQYNRIHGRLSERILRLEHNEMITMEIFQAILDNVPFQDYKWIPIIDPPADIRAPIIQRGWNNPGVEAFLTSD